MAPQTCKTWNNTQMILVSLLLMEVTQPSKAKMVVFLEVILFSLLVFQLVQNTDNSLEKSFLELTEIIKIYSFPDTTLKLEMLVRGFSMVKTVTVREVIFY